MDEVNDNVHIILIPLSKDFDGRKLSDSIKEKKITWDSIKGYGCKAITVGHFMDYLNDNELDMNDWWVSYATVTDFWEADFDDIQREDN
jgi:hypothetical protein